MFWLQFLTLLLCIFIGARLGGVGLGVMGGVGMAILVLEKIQSVLLFLLQLFLIYSHYVQVLVTLPILYFLLLQKSLVNQGLDRNAQCRLP